MADLKRLRLKANGDINYPEDVDKIVNDFKQHGYEITRNEAASAWELYSDIYSAGWLNHVQDEDTFYTLKNYFNFDEAQEEVYIMNYDIKNQQLSLYKEVYAIEREVKAIRVFIDNKKEINEIIEPYFYATFWKGSNSMYYEFVATHKQATPALTTALIGEIIVLDDKRLDVYDEKEFFKKFKVVTE